MIYNTFRVFLWFMYVCFFRRVYYLNSEHIPKKEPLIFISNHSNGFMDPILIAAMQPRPVYFWARATEFPNNFKGWLMYQLHGLPIYRVEEGKENMHKNEATFQKTRDLLYTGWSSAFVAPEGNCVIQKELRPFKKGCARLAFKMMEEKDWSIDVKILPAGVNYTYHDKFRSEVYTKLGKPLSVQDYKEAYLADSETAVEQLTADMRVALRAEMIYVEEEDEQRTEKLLVWVRNNFKRNIFPLYLNKSDVFDAEQRVANSVTAMSLEEKTNLDQQIEHYEEALAQAGVDDYAVAEKNKRSVFLLFLGLPFWILGTISGRIPHVLARNLRNKFVPFREFSTSFAFTAAFIIWIIWSLLFIGISAFFVGWWSLLVPFTMVLLQTHAYHLEDYYREWRYLKAYKGLKNETKEQLKAWRTEITILS